MRDAASEPVGTAMLLGGATRLSLVVVFGVALVVVHALVPTPVPAPARALAALPGIAALALWARYLARGNFEQLPFLEYAVAQFYLLWGLPSVTLDRQDMPGVGSRALLEAVLGACVVTVVVVLVHPAGRRLGALFGRTLETLLPRTAPQPTPLLVVPWLAVAVLANARIGEKFLPLEVQYVTAVLGSYPPLLVCLAWRDRRGDRRSWGLAACTAAIAAAGLLTGMMEAVVQPVIVAIAIHVVFRRRVPWRLLTVGAILLVALNPAKHYYRDVAWNAETRDARVAADPLLAAQRWWAALVAAWTAPASERARYSRQLASRLDELTVNAVCFERTPGSVPFDEGRNWALIPLTAVPRFLYPDKPNFTVVYNDRFNVMFGFQTWAGTEGSTGAFPLVADGYWNFGWIGIVVAAAVVGLVIGIFSGAFRASTWGVTSVAVTCLASLHATYDLSAQVMGNFQRVVGVGIACWLVWLLSSAMRIPARSQGARP